MEGKMVVKEGDVGGCEVNHDETGMTNGAMVKSKEGRYTKWMLVQRPRRSRKLGVVGVGVQDNRRNSCTQGWNEGRGLRFSALEREGDMDLPDLKRGPWESFSDIKEDSWEITPLKESTNQRLVSREESETGQRLLARNEVRYGRKKGPTSMLNGQRRQGVKMSLGSQSELFMLDQAREKLGQEEDNILIKEYIPLPNEHPGASLTVDGFTSKKGRMKIAAGKESTITARKENKFKAIRLKHKAMEEDKDPPNPGASKNGFYMVHSNPLSGDSRLEEAPMLAGIDSSSCQVGQ